MKPWILLILACVVATSLAVGVGILLRSHDETSYNTVQVDPGLVVGRLELGGVPLTREPGLGTEQTSSH